ncbi:MAG: putative SprT family Zn-dependent metalloprotease, partial [Enterobacterales bacterium]
MDPLNHVIVQTPRFLAFGFTHNTLILGFELLLSLSKQEVTAVIAHELGHLSGNHSKFHGWIYRARNTWENMMYNLDQHNGWASAPLRWFFNW